MDPADVTFRTADFFPTEAGELMANGALIKIGRRQYVLVPKKRYEQLTQEEQDKIDFEIADRAMKKYLAGKLKTITHEEMLRKVGMK
jgi:hypothetical protein